MRQRHQPAGIHLDRHWRRAGFGRTIAEVVAAAGARLLVATRTEQSGAATIEMIHAADGEAQLLVVDFNSRAASQASIDAASLILVNSTS